MSTTSTAVPSGSAVTVGRQGSPRMSSSPQTGLTGMTRLPRRWSSAAMRWLSRSGLGEQPTTAHVPGVESSARIVSSEFSDAIRRG
jgi:hypothetical protein